MKVENGKLEPVDATDVDQRLAAGTHTITVRVGHSSFTGFLTVEVEADISGELLPDGVLLNRDLTAYAVNGHFSDFDNDAGYLITVRRGRRVSNITASDGVAVEQSDNAAGDQVLTVKLSTELSGTVDAVITASATCDGCAVIPITISVKFVGLTAPSQNKLIVSEDATAYNHPIVIPAELDPVKADYHLLSVTKDGGRRH